MTGAQIKYILTIYQIQRETGARLTDIAGTMKISKPSVYQMVGQLNKAGLIKNNGQGKYSLTEVGQELAADYLKQYIALYQFFIQEIRLEQEVANEVATSLLAVDRKSLSELCLCIERHRSIQREPTWHCNGSGT